MEHRKFTYKNLDELKEDITKSGAELPISDNLDILKTELLIGGKRLSNRLAIHPMEGCDGTAEGAPDELTFRRYERFGAGGAGLLWVEACATTNEGRANPQQIYINKDTLPEFKRLFDGMMKAAQVDSANGRMPYTVLQLTHSGRYSKSHIGASAIVAVSENPHLDPFSNPKRIIITDEELEQFIT